MGDELSQEAVERQRAQRVGHVQQTEQADSGSSGDQSQLEPASTSYPDTLLGSTRLGGRGNGTVRTAMIQNAQNTYGNRAVQRLLRKNGSSNVSVQRDDPPGTSGTGGIIGAGISQVMGGGNSIIAGVIAGLNALAGPAPNEAVRAMYNSGVSDQISSASMHLQSNNGDPPKEELVKADEEVKSARRVNRNVFESFPEDDKHAYVVARMKLLNNKLVTLSSNIEPLMGEYIPVKDIEQIVEMNAGRAEELEDLVASGGKDQVPAAPAGGVPAPDITGGHNPLAPSGGQAPAQPGAVTAPDVTPQGAGGNSLTRTLWQSTVIAPLKEAAADLKGRPSHAKMERALEKLVDASFGVMSVSGTFPKDSVAQVRMNTFLERLYAARAQLYAHLEVKKKHHAEPQAGSNPTGMWFGFMLVPWLAKEAEEIAELVARA
jgi:hypothetical protein